ncbi:PhzF family phenazine biosynthesis protein [Neisseria chenwenguii]|uniref:Isomerase n=1 Tax=Neisseria chenwenguii TaxID=1853278 RepID=A0A220S533_9NEIS|nr:PhzF family phenazine biosynthesis protein [Neisseria chenwenguii]ASK28557.1 isomerase [Neisseria chenwenguii]ROV57425.1 PhzF family phenazine biosynthesis protein [Neisseria chenwenguii]
MATPFYLVNVFAETHFGGNPLAVFPQADGLDGALMQQIARQFNLSETVFVHRPERGEHAARLRIFMPDYELPFAGHPTLGAAFVLHGLWGLGGTYTLETLSGAVEIRHQGSAVSLSLRNGVQTASSVLTQAAVADLLGLAADDVAEAPVWVNTGTWQLLAGLKSFDAVACCGIADAARFARETAERGVAQLYAWAEQGGEVVSRMFFLQNGAVVEDTGTGSAAVNLGGLYFSRHLAPFACTIRQGDSAGRPNRLTMSVDADGVITVGGNVVEVGQGRFVLP